jgi:exonuclease VII large subunit
MRRETLDEMRRRSEQRMLRFKEAREERTRRLQEASEKRTRDLLERAQKRNEELQQRMEANRKRYSAERERKTAIPRKINLEINKITPIEPLQKTEPLKTPTPLKTPEPLRVARPIRSAIPRAGAVKREPAIPRIASNIPRIGLDVKPIELQEKPEWTERREAESHLSHEELLLKRQADYENLSQQYAESLRNFDFHGIRSISRQTTDLMMYDTIESFKDYANPQKKEIFNASIQASAKVFRK